MITCSVCGKTNDHLSVVCAHCRAFLQAKVDNLNLFTTGWNVLERPFKTFYEIAIAHHKNYIFLLSSILGIGYVFCIFWLVKAGEYTPSFLNLLLAGVATGPVIGIALNACFAGAATLIARRFQLRLSYLGALAVLVYAQVPVALTVLLFLPLEFLTFGLFLFLRNPSPYMLRPVSFVLLAGLDGLFALWSILLMTIGLKVTMNCGWLRSIGVVMISIIILAVLIAVLLHRIVS